MSANTLSRSKAGAAPRSNAIVSETRDGSAAAFGGKGRSPQKSPAQRATVERALTIAKIYVRAVHWARYNKLSKFARLLKNIRVGAHTTA